jgi:hypothetical protein
MPMETTLQPRQKWWNLVYAIVCAVLGLWGAYDYVVRIPASQARYDAYVAMQKERDELGALAARSPEQTKRYQDLSANLDAVASHGEPQKPSWYDMDVQLWLYIVGTGLLGTPWFLWQWLGSARKHYRLDDDGTLHCPEGTFTDAQIADIDMSKWMRKSIATVVTTDGRRIALDDYKFKGMDRIVGAIASGRYPEKWTEDARDVEKVRAEKAASSGGA